MNLRPAACFFKENKILLLKYEYAGIAVYNLPGGNHEEGESISNALAREMNEEIGVQITVGELLFTAEIAQKSREIDTLHMVFECQIIEFEPILNPSETSAIELNWIEIDLLDQINMYPNLGLELKNKFHKREKRIFLGKINQPWF
jgi:8-oxo-dGTP diphosphatase